MAVKGKRCRYMVVAMWKHSTKEGAVRSASNARRAGASTTISRSCVAVKKRRK